MPVFMCHCGVSCACGTAALCSGVTAVMAVRLGGRCLLVTGVLVGVHACIFPQCVSIHSLFCGNNQHLSTDGSASAYTGLLNQVSTPFTLACTVRSSHGM